MTDRDEVRARLAEITDPDNAEATLALALIVNDPDVLAFALIRKALSFLREAQDDDHPHLGVGREGREDDIDALSIMAELLASRIVEDVGKLENCRCAVCQADAAPMN